MQRIGVLVVGLLLLATPRAPGQQATGTTLWRVAATTLPVPPALTLGPAAVMWNPAQTQDSARLQLALEAIQTPAAVDATGPIAGHLCRYRGSDLEGSAGDRPRRHPRALRHFVRAWIRCRSPVWRGRRGRENGSTRSHAGSGGRLQRWRALAPRRRLTAGDRQVSGHAGARHRCERPRFDLPGRCGHAVSVSVDLLSLTPEAARATLAEWLTERGEAPYRVRQVVPRLWQRAV